MHKNEKYIARDFKVEVSCYYKNTLGGVIDIYILDRCIAQSISQLDFEELKRILKLTPVVK